MAAYKDLIGQKITKVTSNPGEPKTGQMWYNSTDGKLRGLGIVEAFSSASPLSTTREGAGAFGTQTTAVICGGETPSVSGATEEYNGTGFSAGGTMNTARYRLQGTAGTATAGIVFGGVEPATSNKTETYNGTAWTSSPYTLNTARWCAGAGIQTSALAFGGGPSYKNNTEEFDGEGWTAVNTLNTSRNSLSGAGANAEECLAFGGETSSPPAVATNATESWDGTSWTEVNNLNTARYGGYGAGTLTAAILIGGIVGPGTMQSAAETWDGTNWTSSPASLATARGRLSVAGSSTAAIAMAGQTPSITTATEEYNKSTNTITAAAWAAGGNMGTARDKIAGFGSQTSAIAANGDTYPPSSGRYTAGCEEYNGTSWTGIASNNTSTAASAASKLSPSSAGSVFGGEPVSARHEYWNGSAWSEQTDANTPSNSSGGAGTQTASIKMGGVPGAPSNTGTEEWNGSSWSNQNDMPHGVTNSPGSGTQTAALIFGGNNPAISTTAEYDGTNWTTSGNMLLGREQLGGSGTQTDTLAFGGRVAPPTDGKTETEGYDGTTWSTRPSLGTGRRQQGSAGVVSSASLSFGGEPDTTATEEFTGETTAANVTDFTTS